MGVRASCCSMQPRLTGGKRCTFWLTIQTSSQSLETSRPLWPKPVVGRIRDVALAKHAKLRIGQRLPLTHIHKQEYKYKERERERKRHTQKHTDKQTHTHTLARRHTHTQRHTDKHTHTSAQLHNTYTQRRRKRERERERERERARHTHTHTHRCAAGRRLRKRDNHLKIVSNMQRTRPSVLSSVPFVQPPKSLLSPTNTGSIFDHELSTLRVRHNNSCSQTSPWRQNGVPRANGKHGGSADCSCRKARMLRFGSVLMKQHQTCNQAGKRQVCSRDP